MTCRDCVLGSSKIVKEKPSRPCTKATDVLKFYGILHALLGILRFSGTYTKRVGQEVPLLFLCLQPFHTQVLYLAALEDLEII